MEKRHEMLSFHDVHMWGALAIFLVSTRVSNVFDTCNTLSSLRHFIYGLLSEINYMYVCMYVCMYVLVSVSTNFGIRERFPSKH